MRGDGVEPHDLSPLYPQGVNSPSRLPTTHQEQATCNAPTSTPLGGRRGRCRGLCGVKRQPRLRLAVVGNPRDCRSHGPGLELDSGHGSGHGSAPRERRHRQCLQDVVVTAEVVVVRGLPRARARESARLSHASIGALSEADIPKTPYPDADPQATCRRRRSTNSAANPARTRTAMLPPTIAPAEEPPLLPDVPPMADREEPLPATEVVVELPTAA